MRPTRRRLITAGAATLAALGLPGCSAWPPTPAGPMELLHFDDNGPDAAPTLLVMLPGAYSSPDEFVVEGFVATVRQQQLPVDVVIAGARVDHYIEGKVLDRLHDEVIGPARARGVRSVWLLGISLGGLFALAYAARHADQLSGVLTLAPYLGRRTLLTEITRQGGPAAWASGRQPLADDLLEHEVWTWLAGRPTQPPLYLGFGRDDRFVEAHRLLAAHLPAERCFETAGGHDWPVWRTLWHQWLARGLLAAKPLAAA